MSIAQRERAALVATLRDVGPDAPTLCEGWTTRDLAAHLMIREYRPDAAPGILIPRFAAHTATVQNSVAAGAASQPGWDALVGKIASGPPLYSPFKLFDAAINANEMFIHHEDVLRAQPGWTPRTLAPDLAAQLRRGLPLMGRLTLAKVPGRVTLRTPDGATVLTSGADKAHGPAVMVTGPPGELLLFASGRLAKVDFDGDPAAVQAVRDAPKGF